MKEKSVLLGSDFGYSDDKGCKIYGYIKDGITTITKKEYFVRITPIQARKHKKGGAKVKRCYFCKFIIPSGKQLCEKHRRQKDKERRKADYNKSFRLLNKKKEASK